MGKRMGVPRNAVYDLDIKQSCHLATTGVLPACTYTSTTKTLLADAPGALSVDNVAVQKYDRVLVKSQADGRQNGLYSVVIAGDAGTAWQLVRTTDANDSTKVTPNLFVWVEEGDVNADSGWRITTNAPITLDTTSLTFAQFTGAAEIEAGAGLTKTVNRIDMVAGDSSIQVNADSVQFGYLPTGREFLAYNSADEVTNYERGFIRWTNDAFQIGTEAGGTGAIRPVTVTSATKITAPAQTALGTEKVTNGTFASDLNGWTGDANWTWVAGKASHAGGSAGALTQTITQTHDVVQVVDFTLTVTAGSIVVSLNGVVIPNYGVSIAYTTSGSYRRSIVPPAATGPVTLAFTPSIDFVGTLDAVSVKNIAEAPAALAFTDSNGTWLELRGDAYYGNMAIGGGMPGLLGGGIAGGNIVDGYGNIAIGWAAGYRNAFGVYNVMVGNGAGGGLAAGGNNVLVGTLAGAGVKDGWYNTYFGYEAGKTTSDGCNNVAIGSRAGATQTVAIDNTFVGYGAGRYNVTGTDNVYLGFNAGRNSTGTGNVFVGASAGYNEAGSNLLYIANSNTATPLIWGDFANSVLKVNGSLTTPSTSAGILLYNTADETTNYERGGIKWNANSLQVGTEKGGTGGSRNLLLYPSGGCVNVAGHLYVTSDSLRDIGSLSSRWKALYLGKDSLGIGASTGSGIHIANNTDSTASQVQASPGVTFHTTGWNNTQSRGIEYCIYAQGSTGDAGGGQPPSSLFFSRRYETDPVAHTWSSWSDVFSVNQIGTFLAPQFIATAYMATPAGTAIYPTLRLGGYTSGDGFFQAVDNTISIALGAFGAGVEIFRFLSDGNVQTIAANPTADNQFVTKSYVDTLAAPGGVVTEGAVRTALASSTGDVSFNGQILQAGRDALATTTDGGLNLFNNTLATAGVPIQVSPSLVFKASGWDTDGGSNVTTLWRWYSNHTTGTGPYSTLTLSIKPGVLAWADIAKLTVAGGTWYGSYSITGSLTTTGNLYVGSGIVATTVANTSITIKGNRADADTGADVVVNSTVDRGAGYLFDVQNNGARRFAVSISGTGVFTGGIQSAVGTYIVTGVNTSATITGRKDAADAGYDVILQANSASRTAGGIVQVLRPAIGTNVYEGLTLTNSTDAALNAQQFSPMIQLTGQGWKTDATAASVGVSFAMQCQPIQGAAAPTGKLIIYNKIGAAPWSAALTLSNEGSLTVPGDIAAAGGRTTVVGSWLLQNTPAGMVETYANRSYALDMQSRVWVAAAAGSILGLTVGLSEAITAGTLTLKIRGGVDASTELATLTLNSSSPIGYYYTWAKDTLTFSAGHKIRITFATSTDFAPNGTMDGLIDLWIEQ